MSLIALSDRLHDYGTIYNFRDFGGYAGADGRPVKTGHLYRSAHLNNLSETEISAIGGLDIGLIVDLRHAPERERQPSKLYNPVPAVFEYPDAKRESGKVAPHEAFMQHDLKTAEDAHNYMLGSYRARPDDAGFRAIFSDTIRHLISDERDHRNGVLVHCAAGKDRTGTLVAIIQGLLGVSSDDIMADYMLTMEAVNVDAILGPASKMFTQRYGREIDAEALRPMFGVTPEFLNASLETMGDINLYAKNALELSSQDIDELRRRYLAEG